MDRTIVDISDEGAQARWADLNGHGHCGASIHHSKLRPPRADAGFVIAILVRESKTLFTPEFVAPV